MRLIPSLWSAVLGNTATTIACILRRNPAVRPRREPSRPFWSVRRGMWVLWTLHGITSLNRLLHSAIRTMRRDKTPPVPCGQRKVGFEDFFDFVVRKSLQGRLMRNSKEAFSACLARIYTGQGAVFPYVRGAPRVLHSVKPFPRAGFRGLFRPSREVGFVDFLGENGEKDCCPMRFARTI